MSATFVAAGSLEEALDACAAGARPIAGGTDLVVGARAGTTPMPDALVAIHGLDELRSLSAGADLMLMTGSGSWNEVYPHLLERARRSPSFRARVREAAGRVLALKRELELRPVRR